MPVDLCVYMHSIYDNDDDGGVWCTVVYVDNGGGCWFGLFSHTRTTSFYIQSVDVAVAPRRIHIYIHICCCLDMGVYGGCGL